MTVIKVIKSLTRREDKAEERKKLKGGQKRDKRLKGSDAVISPGR